MIAALVACKEPRPVREVPPIAALAAIPADASVVIGIDVARLAMSPLAIRAVDQMLVRDPALSERFARLARDCGIDVVRQVRSVFLALGPPASGASLLVATGALSEPALARCLQAGIGSGGAALAMKEADGRRVYTLTEARRVLHFAFGQADTLVIGPSEPWVLAALGAGPKIESAAGMKDLLSRVDRSAAIWAVAQMDPALGASLVQLTQGKVAHPPRALFGAVDATTGIRTELSFVMDQAADAEALAGFARAEVGLLAMAAQTWGLGAIVGRVTVDNDGALARFRISLNDEELKQLLTAIDRGRPTRQDAQPVSDAGLSPASMPYPDAGPPNTP